MSIQCINAKYFLKLLQMYFCKRVCETIDIERFIFRNNFEGNVPFDDSRQIESYVDKAETLFHANMFTERKNFMLGRMYRGT